ncbi:MAG: multidrug effflux MFS transporter [Paracoccaceae bacterium]
MILPDAGERAAGRVPGGLLAFLALLSAMVALTIDAVLPALDAIDRDLGFADPNDRQLVVMAVLMGLALAQVVVGPLADAFGRRTVALGGLGLYLVGTLLALFAPSPEALIAGRFVQGVGAAGPRVMAVTIARDLYEGRPMARVVSLVNTIFMLVPMLAPLAGQGIEALGGWHAIFVLYALTAAVAGLWYLAAVPETLPPERRRRLSFAGLAADYREVLTTRRAVLCTLVTACAFGGFTAYLASAQQIFEELYGLGPRFPIAFAVLAAAFSLASVLNARLVMRFGSRPLSSAALVLMAATGGLGAALSAETGGVPPLWAVMALFAVVFFAVASVFANTIALATEPLGHVAGTATSVVLAGATFGASAIGTVVARGYDGTVTPLFLAFAVLGALGALILGYMRRREAIEAGAAAS